MQHERRDKPGVQTKGGNVTSTGWQVTQCDRIWHVSSRSGEIGCKLLYFRLHFLTLLTTKHLCL